MASQKVDKHRTFQGATSLGDFPRSNSNHYMETSLYKDGIASKVPEYPRISKVEFGMIYGVPGYLHDVGNSHLTWLLQGMPLTPQLHSTLHRATDNTLAAV